MAEEMHEVDDAEMLEEAYDAEGGDYAMSFGGGNGESAGGAPERPTDQDVGHGGRGGRGGRDDW